MSTPEVGPTSTRNKAISVARLVGVSATRKANARGQLLTTMDQARSARQMSDTQIRGRRFLSSR